MLNGMHLNEMPQQIDPVAQQKIRRKMVTWYTRMAHKAEFDDQASFESYGDLVRDNMPSLREFLMTTISVPALAAGSRNYGAA